MNTQTSSSTFISSNALLEHWQGHRRLTRRTIEAFPEDKLFSFSVGTMRPFGALAMEMIGMAAPMVHGVVTGEWKSVAELFNQPEPATRDAILALWDESTKQINELWPQIPPERFHETVTAFGQYKGVVHDLLLYIVDNETHHRAQGYVYLRALGINPPPFYERQ
ncbi:MAG: DinB family protein [Vicinamibacterales bacterium]